MKVHQRVSTKWKVVCEIMNAADKPQGWWERDRKGINNERQLCKWESHHWSHGCRKEKQILWYCELCANKFEKLDEQIPWKSDLQKVTQE